MAVDLDQEADKKGQNGVFYISITKTAVIRMEMLKAYIAKKASWDDHILACMSKFLGIVLTTALCTFMG